VSPCGLAAETEYAIPERSGEVLIVPPPDRVPALIAAARQTAWDGAEILGTPLAEFRRRVRARALRLAADYAGVAPPSLERPLIAMGHQPVFFHPGVWVKYFLLTRLSTAHDATGLHLIVDTDAAGPIAAEVPEKREYLDRVTETLADPPEDTPLEAVRAPDPPAWRDFVARVRARLATLDAPDLERRLDVFASGEPEARGAARTLGEFVARLRRRYEARGAAPAYLELPVSALAETPEFLAFALHLLQDPDALRREYNGSLDEYRRAHRVRSSANPFPDLTREDRGAETPFWVVRGGSRAELFCAREDGRIVLSSGAGPLAVVPAGGAGVDALACTGVSLRPKAVMLTLFIRLCLADVFIHGVGGGRYDQVTDCFSEAVFGCRPPKYVVATATLHLLTGLLTGAPAAGRQALRRLLMDLQHNPDRHLAAPSEAERRLIEEKWALIREVETMRPGPQRRATTSRIREVNRLLAGALAPEVAVVEARLAALRNRRDPDEVVRYREYPFFLFDPADVDALLAAP
jgi:hypothetical protein